MTHKEKVEKKHEALNGKQAVLEMWEKLWEQDDQAVDYQYLIGLRARVRTLRVNLLAMRPIEDEERLTDFF